MRWCPLLSVLVGCMPPGDITPPTPTPTGAPPAVRAVSFAGALELTAWDDEDDDGDEDEDDDRGWSFEGALDFVYWDALDDGAPVCRLRWALTGDLRPEDACPTCLGGLALTHAEPTGSDDACDALPDRADLEFLLRDGDGGDLRRLQLAPWDLLSYVGYEVSPDGVDVEHIGERFAAGGLEVIGLAFVPGDGWLSTQGGLDAASLPWGTDGARPMFVAYRDAVEVGRPLRGTLRLASLWVLDLAGGRPLPAP